MPFALIALSKVDGKDAGLASSMVNTGQVVGVSIAWPSSAPSPGPSSPTAMPGPPRSH